MTDTGDLFGRALCDWAAGGTKAEILERDDGFRDVGAGHELYLAPYRRWPASERRALRHVRGRVVDVGCGAGRVALYLQDRGHDVVALDASAGAVSVARRRGVAEAWCTGVDALAPRLGAFGTVVLFGNNLGLFATPARLAATLRRWAATAAPGTRILAQSTNPYAGGAPGLTRAYYFANRRRGRLGGQVRLRLHYDGSVGPFFGWLFLSRRELADLAGRSGWRIPALYGGAPDEPYVAVLERP